MPHDDGVTSAWFEWIYKKEDLSKVLVVEVKLRHGLRHPTRPGEP
jgi:hypothetical protein